MDFSKFEKVENTFARSGGNSTSVREQSFSFLRYKKSEKTKKDKDGNESKVLAGHFYLATDFFNSANLAAQGLCQFTAPDGETVIAVVADKDAEIMKITKKGKSGNKVKNFKSPKLEAALSQAAVIDEKLIGVSQIVDLEQVATNVNIKGVDCLIAYTIKKGETKEVAVKETKAEQLASTPKVEAQPVAEAKTADANWD